MEIEGERGSDARRAVGERGQIVPLALILVAVLGLVLAVALADVGGAVIDRQRARTAADAAALAGVSGGRDAAAELAARNGATLVGWATGPAPEEVSVVVRVGGATAVARATDAP